MSKKRQSDAAPSNGSLSPQAKKPRREYTEEDAFVAKLFDDLASDDAKQRQAAAVTLVERLESLGSKLTGRVFMRLVRGLCSSRKSARLGFFVALTEFWRVVFASPKLENWRHLVGPSNIFEHIEQNTQPSPGATTQEKRDYALGRLTAFKSVSHSECLFGASKAFSERSSIDLFNAVFRLANEHVWLREQAAMVVCEALTMAARCKAPTLVAQAAVESLCAHSLAKTPEGIAVWLSARTNFPSAPLPKKIWHNSDPLNKKELQNLVAIMKQNQSSVELESSAPAHTGARQRSPHFAWNILLPALFAQISTVKDGEVRFFTFWNDTIDRSYFAANASSERKSLGFQIFSRAIALAPVSTIEGILSPNFMNCLINQTSKADRYLHKTAKTVLDALSTRAKADSSAAGAILTALTTGSGSLNFDRLTNTKTVQNILTLVDEDAAQEALKVFKAHFEDAALKNPEAAEQTRRTVVDVLLHMCRGRQLESEWIVGKSVLPVWLKDVTFFFAYNGFVAQPEAGFSEETPAMVRSRLSSALAHLIGTNSGLASELECHLLKNLSRLRLQTLAQADKHVQEVVRKSFGSLEKLHASRSQSASDQSFTLLFASTLLEALGGATDALSLLDELNESLPSSENTSNQERTGALMDIVLGLVSRQSALHSRLGEQVFQGMANDLSEEDLDAMLDILGQQETIAGQQALFEQGEDAEMQDAEDAEGDEEDDDVEIIEADTAEGEDPSAATSPSDASSVASSNSSAEDDEDGEEDEELKRFDTALSNILKTEDNADSASDSSMDDEQMMALEPALAAVFRERAAADSARIPKKRARVDAKQNVVAFKNRVLDLLATYVRTRHAAPLTIKTILPLLRLIRATSHKQLADKTAALLQRYFDAARSKGMPDATTATAVGGLAGVRGVLAAVHAEALLFASKAHAAAASKASLFLARVLIKADPSEVMALVDVYASTHKRCLELKSRLPASFWNDWVAFSLSVRRE